MSAANVVHAYPSDLRYKTLCHEPGLAASGFADDWTCRDCIRVWRLLLRVGEAAERFRHYDDVRDLIEAVAPGVRAVDHLGEAEARRVLVVLEKVLAAHAGTVRFSRRDGAS